ncbi:MAG: hypothetical protein K8F52_15080 [Candidatus Scalindua rubra]|nr:hypothetical protein [Candidatus Scalindua rubra]
MSDISKKLQMKQSAVSHNMKRLFLRHFVEVKREGKEKNLCCKHRTISLLLTLIDKHIRTLLC